MFGGSYKDVVSKLSLFKCCVLKENRNKVVEQRKQPKITINKVITFSSIP